MVSQSLDIVKKYQAFSVNSFDAKDLAVEPSFWLTDNFFADAGQSRLIQNESFHHGAVDPINAVQ